MGWERVEYKCGHKDEIQMYGKESSRDAEVERLSHRLCPECYARQRAREAAATAAEQAAAGLPALTGSDKQIAWALKIRSELLDVAADGRQRLDALDQAHPNTQRSVRLLDAALDALRRQTRASWWIDHRSDNDALALAKAAVPELYAALVAESRAQS